MKLNLISRFSRRLNYLFIKSFLSIRRFLALCLIGILTLIITIIAILNYWQVAIHDREMLQMQLINAAEMIENLSALDLYSHSPSQLRLLLKNNNQLDQLTLRSNYLFSHYHPVIQNELVFEVWDTEQGSVIIRSDNAPLISSELYEAPGFHELKINNDHWQVLIIEKTNQKLRILVGINNTYLYELNRKLFINNLMVLLIVYLITTIIVLLAIEFALNSLKRVTREVSRRDPNNLHAISFHEVPIEIRPLLKELNKLFRKVKGTIEREKRFTADAAHELRTPLAALKTQVEVARRQPDEQLRTAILKNIITGANRCAHVIDQLLTLSRLEPQASLSQIELIDLNMIARDMIAELAPAALEKHTQISFRSPNKTMMILGNSISIQILLRNLIDNAIRYTPNHGKINVLLSDKSHLIILQVIDNGPGIPAHLRQRIFERFYRELGNKAEGSGLGLSIVQHIVRLHHAKIQAKQPENGNGLEMKILFPKPNHP